MRWESCLLYRAGGKSRAVRERLVEPCQRVKANAMMQ